MPAARLFPYQVWAAYEHALSDDWERALGRTLEVTIPDISALDGTLVVIDTSGQTNTFIKRLNHVDPRRRRHRGALRRLGRSFHLRLHRHQRWFDPERHRCVVIFTDDQQHDSGEVRLDHVPLIDTFDLAGYRPSPLPAGERGRYTIGGASPTPRSR